MSSWPPKFHTIAFDEVLLFSNALLLQYYYALDDDIIQHFVTYLCMGRTQHAAAVAALTRKKLSHVTHVMLQACIGPLAVQLSPSQSL